MLPYVLNGLRNDLIDYGSCVYSITDDEDEFSITRHNPFKSYYRMELY